MSPKKVSKPLTIALSIPALLGLANSPTWAGETDPTLLITRAVATDTSSGTLLRIDALFPWNALIQSGYPLRLVVWHGMTPPEFVQFDLEGGARSGTNPAVVDGLETAEVVSFAISGQPDVGHVLTHVEDGRLEAVLGSSFADVPLGAQLYVIDQGTPFVSNPIAVTRALP